MPPFPAERDRSGGPPPALGWMPHGRTPEPGAAGPGSQSPGSQSAGSHGRLSWTRSRPGASRPGHRWPSSPPIVPQLVVPAYFHPAVAAEDWARLVEQAAQIRLVILNPASGPGDRPDPAFLTALAPLRDAGVQVAGYVDTNYGERPRRDALTDIELYREWYDVAGVMFDRVSAGLPELRHYALLARRARKLGAQSVVFNHGVHPHEAYARHADVLGTFEGPWSVYLEQAVPRWTRRWPADRFYHVVYSIPPGDLGNAFLIAGRRRAGCVYVTDQGGGNPYRRLPTAVPTAVPPPWLPR